MRTSTCPECGEVYRVLSGGHCMVCHRTFAGESAGLAHRKGKFHPPGLRHCVDFDNDFNAKGVKVTWRRNKFGEWTNNSPRPPETYPRSQNVVADPIQ